MIVRATRREFTVGGLAAGVAQAVPALSQGGPLRFQLNWFHDPTFAAAYVMQSANPNLIQILEGGPAIAPLAKLRTGEADAAVIGLDIFLRAVGEDLDKGSASPFRLLGVDLQRSPVGYVLHPEVGAALGLTGDDWNGFSPKQRNDWLFDQIRAGRIKVGDKTGTETTAIWLAWKALRAPGADINLVLVGFDPQIVLQKPALIFPVYLNEEPFKLKERIGRSLLVFDPTDDGLNVYGNVIVTAVDALRRNRAKIAELTTKYFNSWRDVQRDQVASAQLVMRYYKDVSEGIVRAQVQKTTEFVFFGGANPGTIEMASGGKLDNSIRVFRNAKAISEKVNIERIRAVTER